MNKMRLFTRAVFIFLCVYSYNAVSQRLQFSVSGPGIDRINSVIGTSDEGLILAGETSANTSSGSNALLMKIDKKGKISWMKSYGTPSDKEKLNDVKVTPDRGLIAVGERYLANPAGRGEVGVLIKTDGNGRTQWWKEFDHEGNEAEGFSIQLTRDQGYVIGGMMKDLQAVSDPFFSLKKEQEHFYALKTDKDGNSEWSGFFSGDYNSKAMFVQQTSDGGYVLTGHIYKPSDPAATKITLCKLDIKGNLQWVRVYDNEGRKEETGISVYETSDQGYAVFGTTYDGGAGDADIFLIKTNSRGDIQWSKTYGGPSTEHVKSVMRTKGGYLITGATKSFGKGSFDPFLFQVEDNGEAGWFRTYGSSEYEMSLSVSESGSGLVLAGFLISSGTSADGFMIRTDANGQAPCSVEHSVKTGNFLAGAIQPELLRWELSNNSTAVKSTQNHSQASPPLLNLKPMCSGNNSD